jgi:salicylate hydroxylase
VVSARDPILVVGGGLGGLTAALALAQRGLPVQVLEGAPEFGAIGYGIQFGPNVFHVFDRIGVSEAVLGHADMPPGVILLDALSGQEVTRVPSGRASFRERFRYPYIIIHRIDLHQTLLDACRREPLIELVPQAMVARCEDRGDRVMVHTDDGRTFDGTAVIGADGLRSRVRAQLFGGGDPKPIGYVAHRTIVPMTDLPPGVSRDDVVLWAGPGFHVVHYPLRHGALFNIVAVFRTSTHGEKGDVEIYRAELQRTYAHAHPAMKALLAMMDLERRWQIGDRDPVRRWHKGRIVLLGDAAHPTLQSLAQGACMAIEDGLCLAETISASAGDFDSAFRRFAARRQARTARVTLESRTLWDAYHAEVADRETAWKVFARNEPDMFRCLAWLYDGFPFGAGAEQPRRRSTGR